MTFWTIPIIDDSIVAIDPLRLINVADMSLILLLDTLSAPNAKPA